MKKRKAILSCGIFFILFTSAWIANDHTKRKNIKLQIDDAITQKIFQKNNEEATNDDEQEILFLKARQYIHYPAPKSMYGD